MSLAHVGDGSSDESCNNSNPHHMKTTYGWTLLEHSSVTTRQLWRACQSKDEYLLVECGMLATAHPSMDRLGRYNGGNPTPKPPPQPYTVWASLPRLA